MTKDQVSVALVAILQRVYQSVSLKTNVVRIIDGADDTPALRVAIRTESDFGDDEERSTKLYIKDSDTLEDALGKLLFNATPVMRSEIEQHLLEEKRVQPSLFDTEVLPERKIRSL